MKAIRVIAVVLLFGSALAPSALLATLADSETCPPRPSTPCILADHVEDVTSVAFTPAGDRLASASVDGTIKLWNVPTGTLERSIQVGRPVWSVSFSPDGDFLALSGTGRIELREAQNGEMRWTTRVTGGTNPLTFSPDGQFLAVGSNRGSDDTVKLLETTTGDVKLSLSGHTDGVRDVAFSPTEDILASASSDETIRLWDIDSGELIETLIGHRNAVFSLSFSPDGSTLASGSSQVILWDVSSGQQELSIRSDAGLALSLDFNPDGRFLATGGNDSVTTIYDVSFGGFAVKRLRGHKEWIRTASFSPEGDLLATGSKDKTVLLWDVSDLAE